MSFERIGQELGISGHHSCSCCCKSLSSIWPPNCCLLGGKTAMAILAGWGGKECGEESCPLCQGPPVPVQEVPMGWAQPGGCDSSGWGCILLVAHLESSLRGGCGFNSFLFQIRPDCLYQSRADGSCHLIPARMHCSCSYREHKTGKTTAN